jgi:hypothetical protein
VAGQLAQEVPAAGTRCAIFRVKCLASGGLHAERVGVSSSRQLAVAVPY